GRTRVWCEPRPRPGSAPHSNAPHDVRADSLRANRLLLPLGLTREQREGQGKQLSETITLSSGGSRRLIGSTTSIGPLCKRLLDAQLVEREGRVVLSRACPDHGPFEAVVYGDAERYLEIQRFDKPGEEPLERQTETVAGCPHDCGICPEHAQHTCLGII